MIRRLAIALLVLVPILARADQRNANVARNSLSDLLASATELSKEAQRDAEVLKLIREAARSLDDFQQNAAVSKALDNIGKAEQLLRQQPIASQRVAQAVIFACEIVTPAKESPTSVDLSKIRAELHSRPIEQLRGVVAEEISVLARTASQVAEVSGILTRAVASASTSSLGGRGE